MTPSGFYAWRTRPESARVRDDRRLKVLVHASFTEGRGYYGSPRVQDDLVEWGERVSRKRTIRLMQEDGLKARVRKRDKVTTDGDHDQPIAAAPAGVHGRATEPAMGQRHDAARDRRERQAVPRRDPGSVFPIRGRLGRECLQ